MNAAKISFLPSQLLSNALYPCKSSVRIQAVCLRSLYPQSRHPASDTRSFAVVRASGVDVRVESTREWQTTPSPTPGLMLRGADKGLGHSGVTRAWRVFFGQVRN